MLTTFAMTYEQMVQRRPLGWAKHIVLANTSIVILPISLLILFYIYAAHILRPQDKLRKRVQRARRFRPRNVLITGVSTPAGLRAARALYATGHNVVGVDTVGYAFLNHARWSKAVTKFYSLAAPNKMGSSYKYAGALLQLIVKENIALWIDCSDGRWAHAQAQAKELVEERSSCVCLVPTLDQVEEFSSVYGFRQLTNKLGLPSLETHTIRSRNDVYNVLNVADGKKYMLSSPNGTSEPVTRTILPRRTVSQTYHDMSRLKLAKGSSWKLEQYTAGLLQFTACGVVVQGTLKAFTVASVSKNGDCKAIHTKHGLSDAMKKHMEAFASSAGSQLSSHLTMEFCLDERSTSTGVVQQILPLNGQLVAHESLLLFDGKQGSINLTQAYMSVLSSTTTELELYTGLPYFDSTLDIVLPSKPNIGVYFLFKDVRGLIVEPLVEFVTFRGRITNVVRSWVTFLHHLVTWQEALYDFGDPIPLFWYTHVFAPYSLISVLVDRAWSRLSTSVSRTSFRRKPDRRKQVLNGYKK